MYTRHAPTRPDRPICPGQRQVLQQTVRELGNGEDEHQVEEQLDEGDAVMLMALPEPADGWCVPRSFLRRYLIASGLTGEPTAPVIGIAGATNRNS
jgi:hypothetical protein